jgi:flavin reductase (DIM6/NTAB) family NADH-FMN oxidoreductase RutF
MTYASADHRDRDELDARRFRDTLGAFASGVTVVTTPTADGGAHGMTVSAFSSLSLDPPLVLVCVSTGSRGRALLERSGAFTVNVLSSRQAHLSRLFADRRRPSGARAFDGVGVRTGSTGCPVLLGCAAHLDCRVAETVVAGDHTIVVGRVVELGEDPCAVPLLVHRGRYRALEEELPVLRPAVLRAS